MRRGRAGAAVLAACLSLAAAPRAGAEAARMLRLVERPEADVLLLAVRLGTSELADALPAYQAQSRVLVPLGEICRLLELGIEVDAPRGLASGFVLDPEVPFRLDLQAGSVQVAGETRPLDATAVEPHRDDLYVDADLLADWLPLRLEVDLHAATITVQSRTPLPLELRLDRERRGAGLPAPPAVPPWVPRTELPYRLLDGPFVDQSLQWVRQALPDGAQSSLQYSTYLTGDLLFAEAHAYVAGTEHGVSDSRFSLGRKDPDGHLLGALGAREVTVGDFFHPGLDLVALPSSGPGLLVSNHPLQRPTRFDRQSFSGDLPPGWQVELYRGDELLAFARSRPDGRYEFLDVPLVFGLNAFRLELYGPQGQRRTETRLLNVGDTLTPKGRIYYRLAGDDPGARLLGPGQPEMGSRSTMEVSAGLTERLSASVSAARVDFADGRHDYGVGGLRAFWGRLFWDAEVARELGGGTAWQGTLQSRLGPLAVQLQHAELDRFSSEVFFSPVGPLRSRTALRLDTSLSAAALPALSLSVDLRQDQLTDGQGVTQAAARLAAFRNGFAVSSQWSWNAFSGGEALPSATLNGQLFVSRLLHAIALRGEADYSLRPASELTGLFLTAEARGPGDLLLSAGINRVLLAGQTRLFAGVSRQEGLFGFSAIADVSRPGGLGARLLATVCIGRDPGRGRWHTQAQPLAGLGAVSGRAFLDANGNGRMDRDELPIPGAGFLLNGAGSLARTDEHGEAFIPDLPPYQDFDLSLATSTLEDPLWKPAGEGIRFVPRPGKVAVLEIPVVAFGEITGTVYRQGDGASREASGVEIELVDPRGAVVKTVRSAYDGFYDLTDLRPGRYTLRVAGASLARQGLLAPPAREVEISPAGTILDGVDLILTKAPGD